MRNLDNWTEESTGLYRYPIGQNFFYEILVQRCNLSLVVPAAQGSLFICGIMQVGNNRVFRRYQLVESESVQDCMMTAEKHYKNLVMDAVSKII